MTRFKYFLASLLFCLPLYAQGDQRKPRAQQAPPPFVQPEDKCSIEGTVVSATSGEPLKKTYLTLQPLDQRNTVPYGTTTDNAGYFLFNDVDPGRYSLVAARNGFVPQSWPPRGNASQNAPLTLAMGQKLKQIVFKLTPQGVITGHVVDQDGEPLARVQLQVMTFAYQRGRRQLVGANFTMTDDLGEFRLFNLKPGKYVISARYLPLEMFMGLQERFVSAPGVQAAGEGYPPKFYPNTRNPDEASQIEVSAGAQIHGIDMRLVRTRMMRVNGRVNMGPPSQPWRDVTLMLIPRDTRIIMNMPGIVGHVFDAKGNFEIRGVAPGSYYLLANYFEEGQRYSARMPIDVGNSNLEDIEVNFQPSAELKGRVVVEGNGGLRGARLNVSLQLPMMGNSSGPVKDDLSFKLTNVSPDAFDLNVFGLLAGFYIKSIRIGDQDITETGVDFTRGVPAGEMTIVINPNGGQIDGTVQNAKSENVAGATVTLVPDESHRSIDWLYKTANADQNGHFTIWGVRPGEYKIFGWEEIEPGSYQDPDFMKPHESAGKAVSVKEGGHETVQLTVIPIEKK